MKHMQKEKFSTVKELSALVWSSESSVRRDIKALENAGYVKQTYGGIVLADGETGVVPVGLRDSENSAVKEKLAREAVKYIRDGDTVFMDGSSTVRRIVKHVGHFKDLKIITNNVGVLSECKAEGVRIYCTGGLFIPKSNIFAGPAAEQLVSQINADVMFFSSQAISLDGNISDSSEEETALRRIMLRNAKKKIFLCDSSKLGQSRTFFLCDRTSVDHVICDVKLPWEE